MDQLPQREVPLFWPHVPRLAQQGVTATLGSRWIGQGPRVDEFESRLRDFLGAQALAVNSGTSALHMAYVLAGIRPGDVVLAPVFTCTATNIPLLYMGARVVFYDVDPATLNADVEDLERRLTPDTRAIVVVHFAGLPVDIGAIHSIAESRGIPVIEDAAHALGASWRGQRVGSISQFTAFSFQAIKHITTGDGGALTIRDEALIAQAKRLRWFGIDREAKFGGSWNDDIVEIGFKYQMNDVAASLGIAGIDDLGEVLRLRRLLQARYIERLDSIPGVSVLGKPTNDVEHAAWLMMVGVTDREGLRRDLAAHGVESSPVHYRNDKYSIFASSKSDFPGMDSVEHSYLALPLHTRLTVDDVDYVCDQVARHV